MLLISWYEMQHFQEMLSRNNFKLIIIIAQKEITPTTTNPTIRNTIQIYEKSGLEDQSSPKGSTRTWSFIGTEP